MKQYRVTSADFVPANSHIPDAHIGDADLMRIQQLAGVKSSSLLETYADTLADTPTPSAVGSIAPTTNAEKRKIEHELNIKTGTPEWFRLWFAKPELTGEKPVGDDAPDAEPNPRYLLDKSGQADSKKLSDLATELDDQAANSSPKY